MHPEALEAVSRMVVASGYGDQMRFAQSYTNPPPQRFALDIGGADVNGSARSLIPYVDTWVGLDIAPGPGVDVVADATNLAEMRLGLGLGRGGKFDVILCTEVLEHVEAWRRIVENIWYFLAPGGFAFITAAGCGPGWGRRPHGARGELDPPIGEHYENINAEELATMLAAIQWSPPLGKFGVMSRPVPGDVYAWIRKD